MFEQVVTELILIVINISGERERPVQTHIE